MVVNKLKLNKVYPCGRSSMLPRTFGSIYFYFLWLGRKSFHPNLVVYLQWGQNASGYDQEMPKLHTTLKGLIRPAVTWQQVHHRSAIGTASANSVESDLGYTSRVHFDNARRWRHKNHVNTITSVIAAKQTVTTFHNKHCYKWSLAVFNTISL